MEEKVVDFFHQSVEVTVWLIAHPREHVGNHLFETVFELQSERLISKASSLRNARFGTKTKETIGDI